MGGVSNVDWQTLIGLVTVASTQDDTGIQRSQYGSCYTQAVCDCVQTVTDLAAWPQAIGTEVYVSRT